MKRNSRWGRAAGIGLTLTSLASGLVNGCSLQRGHYKDYRSHPVIVWPAGDGNVRINAFDKDGVNKLELYTSSGRLIKTFEAPQSYQYEVISDGRLVKKIEAEGNPQTYSVTIPLGDGSFRLRMYDSEGNIINKKFTKHRTEITPKDFLCMG